MLKLNKDIQIFKKELNLTELLNLFYEHEDEVEWDKYDYVDPPYCWSVGFELKIDEYTFYGDGNEVNGYKPELEELYVVDSDGDSITLIERK